MKDKDLIIQLCQMREPQLKRVLEKFLQKYYPKVTNHPHYLLAPGSIPIGLVAHMDTVFNLPPSSFYELSEDLLTSPEGAGFDDRAGIFAVIRIIQSGLRPTIIFTCGEEIGGLGAYSLAARPDLLSNLNFLIELDRRGAQDAVYYHCANTSFMEYIESFGFVRTLGLWSDISILCPICRICGVNLSVGYYDEHTFQETLNLRELRDTIQKVELILNSEPPAFVWQEEGVNYGS